MCIDVILVRAPHVHAHMWAAALSIHSDLNRSEVMVLPHVEIGLEPTMIANLPNIQVLGT